MRIWILALPLVLAACGTLPEPFYGNPGPVAAKLAVPTAPVLMVPPPGQALLADDSARLFAADLATQLVNQDVPCIAGPAGPGNWELGISAKLAGNHVVPSYRIIGPDKKDYGGEAGVPEPAAGWANGDAAVLAATAATDSASLGKLLAAINARVQQGNPQSLENRVPRIFVGAVTGAPGDGDVALPLNLARDLPGPDDEVVADAAQADFTVRARVTATPQGAGQDMVELDWSVFDANHRKIGQVTQLHPLSLTDITPYWGDVAAAAAAEAAGGVRDVVRNAILKK